MLATLLAGLGPGASGTASADGLPRFNHEQHAAITPRPPSCASCHDMKRGNRWIQKDPVASGRTRGHQPCAGCHQHQKLFLPFGDLVERNRFCGTCHEDLARPRDVRYPPYLGRGESSFVVAGFDHKVHVETEGASCAGCHPGAAAAPPPVRRGRKPPTVATPHPHAGCSDGKCHGGTKTKPAMDDCQGCHRNAREIVAAAATGADAPRALPPLATAVRHDYRVTERFDHARHAAGAKENDCAKCHGNVSVPAGQVVPLPPMASCEGCHDGKRAFYALGFGCKKCHTVSEPSGEEGPPPATVSYFRHEPDAMRGIPLACDDCHRSTAEGAISLPVHDEHRPCASCHTHEAEFRTKDSPFCLACHEHSQPWRANPARAELRAASEFAPTLSHASHAEQQCASCHPGESGGTPFPQPEPTLERLAPSHARCAECHASKNGPPMTACGACHAPAGPEKLRSEWSTAARFAHDSHQRDVRTATVTDPSAEGWKRVDASGAAPLPCESCHANARKAGDGEAVTHPQMADCAACHDGGLAFKTTGFGCVRCHGAAETAP